MKDENKRETMNAERRTNEARGSLCRSPLGFHVHRSSFIAHRSWFTIAFVLSGLWCSAAVAGSDDATARREKIAQLTPAEKQQLVRQQERFAALSAGEQQRMRQLYEDLNRDDADGKLHQVLAKYHEWLGGLPEGQRYDLLKLPPSERVEKIKELKQKQELRQALKPRDVKKIVDFLETFAVAHKQELLKGLPRFWQQNFENDKRPDKRRPDAYLWVVGWHLRNGDLPEIDGPAADDLIVQLSPNPQRLYKAAPDAEKKQLLQEWIGMAFRRHMSQQWGNRAPPPVAKKELEQFFRQLPQQQQDLLLSMPGDRMQKLLVQRYFRVNPVGKQPGQSANPKQQKPNESPAEQPQTTEEGEE